MRNYFFEVERERERERERDRRNNKLFKYSIGKKRQWSDPFQPQSKDLEFLTIAQKNAFFLNFAGMFLKDRHGF